MSIGFSDNCHWFQSPDKDFLITNDSSDIFLFGKGQFQFIEWIPRIIKEEKQFKEIPSTNRNAVFLVNPITNEIIFFKPKPEYDDIWYSDLNDNGLWFTIKAVSVLTKVLSFGIMPKCPFFVSMDTPLHTTLNTEHYWHQDYFSMIFMPEILQTEIGIAFNKNGKSDYTMIEYTSKCASTAVKIPKTYCDYARFLAKPGTVVCVNNTELLHSSPIIDNNVGSTIYRNPGNKIIQTALLVSDCEDSAINRFLCRNQIKIISQEAANAIIGNTNIEKITLNLLSVLGQITFSPFLKFTLSDYLNNERYMLEAGGARKRKTMRKRKKNTKKTKKTKRIKNKRRKGVKMLPSFIKQQWHQP